MSDELQNIKEQYSEATANDENDGLGVGKRLRSIRTTRRMTLRALAEESGLNINTLSLIENEHTSPSVSTLQQLAQALQIPISDFFDTDHGNRELVCQNRGSACKSRSNSA